MRLLVILKSKKYYVAERHYNNVSVSPFETFALVNRGDLIVPRDNIEVIEKYTDSTIGAFRLRFDALRKDDRYEDGALHR